MTPEMQSLRAQSDCLAAQGAAFRVGLAGPAPGTAANIQIGERRLAVAFDRTSQQRSVEENGFRYLCDAVAHLPLALGLTEADLPLGGELTYLPAAELYRIEARRAQPGSGFIRLVLRRVNGQSPGLLSL